MKKPELVNKSEAVRMMFLLSPAILEALSGGKIKISQWYGHKSNNTRGSLSGDLADTLLEAVGFKVAQDSVGAVV